MSNNLCRIWSELASHPDAAEAIAEAHAHLTQLVAHVDDCDECRAISESMENETREAVFAALSHGGATLAQEELAILKTMDQVLDNDRKSIDAGVEFLQAGLPGRLATLDQIAEGAPVTPLQVFLGIDAVNLLVRSYASRNPGQSVGLSNAGLRVGGKLVSKREAMVGEIGRHANVTAPVADGLWTWQLAVAELCPTLYRGLEVSNVVHGQLQLKLQKSASSADLIKRWKIQPKETLSRGQFREIVGEFFGIVSAWNTAMEPLSGAVSAVGDKTLKQVMDQITFENREIEALIKPLNVAPITYIDYHWEAIGLGVDRLDFARAARLAERRKRSCLYALAGADIDDAALELKIKALKTYAAKTGRFDSTIQALDRYESAMNQGQTVTGRIKGRASE